MYLILALTSLCSGIKSSCYCAHTHQLMKEVCGYVCQYVAMYVGQHQGSCKIGYQSGQHGFWSC